MAALIAASSLLTCFGDGEQTFASLLKGMTGASALRHPVPGKINVDVGYHVPERDPSGSAGDLLAVCVSRALADAGLVSQDPSHFGEMAAAETHDPSHFPENARILRDGAAQILRDGAARISPSATAPISDRKIVAIIGTGLRELAEVERGTLTDPERLHFAQSVPGIADVITIANACSAGGHALALAQDMIECGEADAVVVGAADLMTTSMLAMIGRVAERPSDQVRPFDRDRPGVLLGEGAGAVVVVGEGWQGPRLGRILSTGLSCDAYHETAPDVGGICRAMDDAYARAGRDPRDIDLVMAHATGTALNDPAECDALRRSVISKGGTPLITGVKGALGHLSGAAALANLDVALRCFERGEVPPVVGLREVLPEGEGLNIVKDVPASHAPVLVQLNAFGFGGVNAVTLLEKALVGKP